MNSAELAARMGEGWTPATLPHPAEAVKGWCTVRSSRIKGYRAEFHNSVSVGNAYGTTPEEAVRSCLLGVWRRLEITRTDLEAVLPGVTYDD